MHRSLMLVSLSACASLVAPFVANPARAGGGASEGPSASAEVEAVLDRLERAGDRIADLKAEVSYEVLDTLIDDKQLKPGRILYRKAEPNAQFVVEFTGVRQEGVIIDKKEWYAFDGRWLTEAHETTRNVIKREIVAEGERLNPFRLGEGPFPLPFGQKKGETLANFAVTLVPPSPADPPDTEHLLCTPLEGTQMADEYRQLDLYVDRKLDLPIKIVADRKKETKMLTVTFTNMRLNTGIAGSAFQFKAPAGWPAPTVERLNRDAGGR